MTNPTPLSPAAQAVLDAFGTYPLRADHTAEDLTPAFAAALRAAANKVLLQSALGADRDSPAFYRWQQKMKTRSWILSIARELEEAAS
jgi:hypothetical protein